MIKALYNQLNGMKKSDLSDSFSRHPHIYGDVKVANEEEVKAEFSEVREMIKLYSKS